MLEKPRWLWAHSLIRWFTGASVPISKHSRLSHQIGARGERVAVKHLKRQGYRILGRNLKTRFGEVDILAQAPDERTIVVVEVKASAHNLQNKPTQRAFLPEMHVNSTKQKKLIRLASQLIKRYRLTQRPIRFDVIGVDLPKSAQPIVRHYTGAFESSV